MEIENGKDKIGKIDLSGEDPVGYIDFNGVNVRYTLDIPVDSEINENNIATYEYSPDSGGNGRTLCVSIWEGAPPEFKEVILYHELVESDLVLNGKMIKEDAHKIAVEKELEYARTYLSQEDLEKFLVWREKARGNY